MSLKEVKEIASEWAKNEGWNPGLHDWNTFYHTDPNGFYVGLIEEEPIACISIVDYPDNFSFLGFYIVKKEFRGRGLGYKLWQETIKNHTHNNIGLDGVFDQQDNYRKSGFKFAYSNIRFKSLSFHSEIKDANIIDFDSRFESELNLYDAEMFPSSRATFLNYWLGQKDSYTLLYFDGKIKGYLTIRKCHEGYKIGPLFADNEIIAEKLYLAALNKIPEQNSVFLDVPEVNDLGMKLAEKYKMENVFGTARMYTGDFPKINLDKIFGVTTFELG